MADQKRDEAIHALKIAILKFLGTNGRHYGDLTRIEQSVEDLAQALNTRLDQLQMAYAGASTSDIGSNTPRQRLADRFLQSAQELIKRGSVDEDTADAFERTLDMFDVAADLHRKADSVKDSAETNAILHKRNGR